jgi:cell division protein FtsN
VRPAPTLSTVPGSDPFTYFVQAGAYARPEDAEQQRARLAMLGLQARLTEREQGGRTVYRVRVGPFDRKEEADATKERLGGAGVDAALVRVQK